MTPFIAAVLGAIVALAACMLVALVVFVVHRRRRASVCPTVPATANAERTAANAVEHAMRDVRAMSDAAMRERVDRKAFRELRESGIASAGPTDLDFFLRFPEQRQAEAAAAQVASLALDATELGVHLDRLPHGAGWLCLVTAHAVPSEAVIRRACGALRSVALEHGGDLDGWGLAVQQ